MEKIHIGVSTCLLGENVRYDGGHKLDRFLRDTLGKYVDYIPVCPEVECGLGIPRESMHLEGDPDNPRLVTTRTGVDLTDRMVRWAEKRVMELESENLSGFIFKSRSPSSGMERINVFQENGQPIKKGVGIFARIFMENFPQVPVEEDGRLNDPDLRENFIEAIFTLGRWRELRGERQSVGKLVQFHTTHKLLILSHSRKHYTEMGRLVAHGKELTLPELYRKYGELITESMKYKATRKKNTDVLMHAMGFFKKVLSHAEKKELLELLEMYRTEKVPLIVPLTLLKHYIMKYDHFYLKEQVYFHPHPLEVMLRNHV